MNRRHNSSDPSGAVLVQTGPTISVCSRRSELAPAIRFGWLAGLILMAIGPLTGLAHGQRHRDSVLRSLPLERLTPEARNRIVGVAGKPTLYRRLPTQVIGCDRDLFLFVTRNPDVLVGLWDLMGITKVQSSRVTPYKINATDGVGTACTVDLVYGDSEQHIFYVEGAYDGKMTPGPIRGKGVFVLRSSYGHAADGTTRISGTLDCFVQLDSLGIDLIARTLSPIIGRSADTNFEQTAHFIAQVHEASVRNPPAMLDIASRLPQVTPPIRSSFAETITTVAQRTRNRDRIVNRVSRVE
ncbi:MAG: hypothetical protein AAGJ40_08740 [Planctomycetota bacterium]